MPSYSTADIRNIALVGHAASGKTSLAEALLREAGALHHLGLVERGSTVSDYSDEEKARGHSMYGALMHCAHQGRQINLIDTPGYGDFAGQAVEAFAAVETVAVVVSAAAGVEPNVRKMMERAAAGNLCRLIVVNKIDHENVDLKAILKALQDCFGKVCLPINLPAQGGKAVVDCFTNTEGDSDLGPVADAHRALVDQIVEVDEKLMEAYLEQGEVKPEQLHAPLEKALREGHLVPVCFTTARRADNPEASVGIKELLGIITGLLPSPAEGNPRQAFKGDDKQNPVPLSPDPAKQAVAHVFKMNIDPFVGRVAVFRVLQGTVKAGAMLSISDAKTGTGKKPFKVNHMFKFQGREHVEIQEAVAGDIAAVAKIDEIRHGAVLHEHKDHDNLKVQAVEFPTPMYGLAVTPKSRADEQKLSEVLAKLMEEDQTFKVVRDASTHETVTYGLGELHLRVILERLRTRNKLDLDTKPPKIAYRETILAKAEGHHRHKKQTGGAGQFGEVYLRVVPRERGAGFEFVDDTFGGNPPKQYLPAIEKGVRMMMETGAVAGYPMQDIRVEVYDGKHHDVDSKEIAFITAGKKAFVDAVQKAKPAVLEPVVKVEITVPQQYMGDIAGDMAGKRGRIVGTDMLPGDQAAIKAIVPLSEVSNYQNQLKSVTGGQGSYTMEFSHYDPVPFNIQQQIVAAYKPKAEED